MRLILYVKERLAGDGKTEYAVYVSDPDYKVRIVYKTLDKKPTKIELHRISEDIHRAAYIIHETNRVHRDNRLIIQVVEKEVNHE